MWQARLLCICLICDLCSSDREFALGLLHTPPPDGRTCPQPTVPTAKPEVDFHNQVTAHYGQAKRKLFLQCVVHYAAIHKSPKRQDSQSVQSNPIVTVTDSTLNLLKAAVVSAKTAESLYLLRLKLAPDDSALMPVKQRGGIFIVMTTRTAH